MRNLLQLLSRYSILLMFLTLEVASLILVVKNNEYQRSTFFSSANAVTGWVYNINNKVTGYFRLNKTNAALREENEMLYNQITDLQNQIIRSEHHLDSTYIPANNDLRYIYGDVINVSTNKNHNYITINKGLIDGVKTDMGIRNKDGVVGIVCRVSEHFSTAIPIINTSSAISCKLAKDNNMGTLQWDGKDYRYCKLNDIAKHIKVEEGDTILTSGYTSIFPQNIPVGVISEVSTTENDSYHNIKVSLFVNFRQLESVMIIDNKNIDEIKQIENERMDQ